MCNLLARARELVGGYVRQDKLALAAASRLLRRWEAGAIDHEEAEAHLARLGYHTSAGDWPCFFAGLLAAIADDWSDRLPIEQRALNLACALDAGKLPEVAAMLRPANPAATFVKGYEVTIAEEELVNRLWDGVLRRRFHM